MGPTGPAISDAAAAVPPEARQQLVEAGCIEDEGFTLDSDEDFLDKDFLDEFDELDELLGELDEIDEFLGEDTDESATVPVSSEMSLDHDAAACPQYDPGGLAEDATNGDVAAAAERWIQVMESIQPPPKVADWHWESLFYGWSIKDLANEQPQLVGRQREPGDASRGPLTLTGSEQFGVTVQTIYDWREDLIDCGLADCPGYGSWRS